MTRSENAPELHSSPDWCYFDAPASDHDRFASDHTYVSESRQPIPSIAKMVSMTKFDGSGTAERWLYILEEELPEQLTPATWLKRANARLDGRAAAWADRTPEVKRILRAINNATTEDKETFVRLLCQEFPGNQNDVMTEEQASTELSILSQKEDENLYAYYRRTEALLIGISGRDRVSHNGENAIILNNAEQHILKDTIAKFGFGLRVPELRLHMIEYRADPMRSLYGAFKKAEAYLDVLNAKAEMQKELELKSGYEAFKSFQATIAPEQNPRPRPYEAAPRKAQSYSQPGLPYRDGKRVDRSTTSYPDRSQQEPYQFRNVYSSQDARVPQGFHHPQTTEQSSAFDPSTSRNPYVNGSAQYIYQWGNPLCYKCGIPGHTSPECNTNTPLSRAESTHLRNLYQRPPPNREFDFPIPTQAHNGRDSAKDQQRPNHNSAITQSHSVIAKTIRPSSKQSPRVVEYNGDSDSDEEEDVEFVDVDLPCNKLSVQLLANNSTTRSKKRRVVIDTDDEAEEVSKVKTTREKKIPVKRVGKKSSKASVPISGLVGKPSPDIQALLMNTNIIIPALHLFQISPKFREETRRLMTVPPKPRKKKVVPPAVPVIEEEEELYAEIHHPKRDTVDTNHALLQTPKQELAEILQSKGEAFRMKATIWKSEKETKYALPDSHVKADQGSDLVIINPKLVKRLGLKVRPTSTLAPHRLGMSVANGDSTELKSWVKFWVEVSGIRQEMWAFITPNENPNVSLLLGLPWLRSVDAKLFIQKKEIYIGDIKKGETVSHIPYSTTPSEDAHFQASSKGKAVVDESSEEDDTKNENEDSSEEESDEESSEQDF